MKRLVFSLLLVFVSYSVADVYFKAEKNKYTKGEKVCFYIENKTNKTIYLPSTAPWAVFEDKNFEKLIFSPISNQVIIKLKPNKTKKWCWKQNSFKEENVSTGEYTIRITYFEGGKRKFSYFNVNIISNYSDAK